MRKYNPDIQVINVDFTKDIEKAIRDGYIHYAFGQRAYAWGSLAIGILYISLQNKEVQTYIDTGTFESTSKI